MQLKTKRLLYAIFKKKIPKKKKVSLAHEVSCYIHCILINLDRLSVLQECTYIYLEP